MKKNPNHRLKKFHTLTWGGVTLLAGILSVLWLKPTWAGPVTGGSNNWPYAKVSVYQGIMAVAPGGSGSSLMEIGNSGRDIASTNTIYWRPLSIVANVGISLFKDSSADNRASIDIPGQLCLSGECKDTWPLSGAGTTYWQKVATHLEPTVLTRRLQMLPAYRPLEIYSNSSIAAMAVYLSNQTMGYAASFESGRIHVSGNLEVTKDIMVLENGTECIGPGNPTNLCKVWHAGNDGWNSKLDAVMLDGEGFFAHDETGYMDAYCTGSGDGFCLCRGVYPNQFGCIQLQ